ncbi:MAG TPA: VOC family protein [Acidimicrobiales bacterium]|jgi:catechol 2,3-dioxygenase-like lactoylglutathione lyase family enzyme
MRLWPAHVDVITLFVEDVARSKAFYANVFELETVYEDANSAVVRFDNLIVNLLDATQAPELIAPAAVAPAGSRFQFTVSVEDVDAACRELAGLGVALLNGPMDRPWGIRTAAFADPDGHVWEFAQD